jgi:hypothetical protein
VNEFAALGGVALQRLVKDLFDSSEGFHSRLSRPRPTPGLARRGGSIIEASMARSASPDRCNSGGYANYVCGLFGEEIAL